MCLVEFFPNTSQIGQGLDDGDMRPPLTKNHKIKVSNKLCMCICPLSAAVLPMGL